MSEIPNMKNRKDKVDVTKMSNTMLLTQPARRTCPSLHRRSLSSTKSSLCRTTIRRSRAPYGAGTRSEDELSERRYKSRLTNSTTAFCRISLGENVPNFSAALICQIFHQNKDVHSLRALVHDGLLHV